MNLLFISPSPTSLLVLYLLFLTAHAWMARGFPTFERKFFSEIDLECRLFVAESYPTAEKLPAPQLPVFGLPLGWSLLTFFALQPFLFCILTQSTLHFGQMVCVVVACIVIQRLFWFDVKHQFLPDRDTAALAILGALFLALSPAEQLTAAIQDSFFTALFALFFFGSVLFGFKAWKGVDGMGGGDIKLFLLSALFVGSRLFTALIPLSCLFGLLFWLGFKLTKKDVSSGFAFGPSVLMALLTTLIFPQLSLLTLLSSEPLMKSTMIIGAHVG
jgi:prepilin signal peptidase PulO-like enzyme (type II secretory pathway)